MCLNGSFLIMCDLCLWVMCAKCVSLPTDLDFPVYDFICITCHLQTFKGPLKVSYYVSLFISFQTYLYIKVFFIGFVPPGMESSRCSHHLFFHACSQQTCHCQGPIPNVDEIRGQCPGHHHSSFCPQGD